MPKGPSKLYPVGGLVVVAVLAVAMAVLLQQPALGVICFAGGVAAILALILMRYIKGRPNA